jgi:uncharacterized repeat protein (TIGR03837 family)
MKSATIFCKIVDNFGDIGVCWRLARQLAHECGLAVTLYVDDLPIFARMERELDVHAHSQTLNGITIKRWHEPVSAPQQLPDLVMETFSCRLPDVWLAAMKAAPKPPIWVNLEHLSAEDWVDDSHNLTSVHPSTGLQRLFFIPGFSAVSGGLLREQSLPAEQADFATQKVSWWQQHIGTAWDDSLKVSLFAYPFAPYPLLLQALEGLQRPVSLLVPEGMSHPTLTERGHVRLLRYPFLRQPDYDRLLWACDVNFVRGEDSFIRALWAGKPFIWQAYAQPENAHTSKIAAFLAHYCAEMPPDLRQELEIGHGVWNLSPAAAASELTHAAAPEGLAQLLGNLAVWSEGSRQATARFLAQSDCVSRLMNRIVI